jgi:hypothetical protein
VGVEQTSADPHILDSHNAAEAWWAATFPTALSTIIKEYSEYHLIIPREVHVHYLFKFWSETLPPDIHTIIHEYADQNMFPTSVSNFSAWMAAPPDNTPWAVQ